MAGPTFKVAPPLVGSTCYEGCNINHLIRYIYIFFQKSSALFILIYRYKPTFSFYITHLLKGVCVLVQGYTILLKYDHSMLLKERHNSLRFKDWSKLGSKITFNNIQVICIFLFVFVLISPLSLPGIQLARPKRPSLSI